MSKLLRDFKRNLFNIPGWRTDRKIVIFESDDWGGTRMPSKKVWNTLLEKGLPVADIHYDKYDNLESKSDFEALYEVLKLHRDSLDQPCVFTFNTVMGNPDFEKMKKESAGDYHFQHFRDTYLNYWSEDLFPYWKQGMEAGFIFPQFHAREHLNVSLWMKALQQNYKETKIGFDYGYYGMATKTPSVNHNHYLSAFHVTDKEDLDNKVAVLSKGLKIFNDTFGYKSDSFIACNYTWPSELEELAQNAGVEILQGQNAQLAPDVLTGKLKVIRHFIGQRNSHNQTYLVRNCHFEPSSNKNFDWVESCLMDVKNAFFWGKPAIISTHRVNYIGSLEESNRTYNLILLEKLLSRLIKGWPGIEFLSTDKLLSVFKQSNHE